MSLSYILLGLLTVLLPFLVGYAFLIKSGVILFLCVFISFVFFTTSIVHLMDENLDYEKYSHMKYSKLVNLNEMYKSTPIISCITSFIMSFLVIKFGLFFVLTVDVISIPIGIIYSVYKAKRIVKDWNEKHYDECGQPDKSILKFHIILEVYNDIVNFISLAIVLIFVIIKKIIGKLFSILINNLAYSKLIDKAKGEEE